MAGGLAALMSGQTVVKKKKGPLELIKKFFRSAGLHVLLINVCILYIYIGAIVFRALEGPHELEIKLATEKRFQQLQKELMKEIEVVKEASKTTDDRSLNSSLNALIDEYTENMFKLFNNPISMNFFDSVFYNSGEYRDLWTMEAAILFTSTTMIPVGFGLISPLTPTGRLFLVVYALIGIPLALVTMSDIGRFICDAGFKLANESMKIFASVLLTILIVYPVVGGIVMSSVSQLSISEGIYYCCITILTVGFGDISPPIPIFSLILFIVFGVMLVTISVDVLGTTAIHQVHFLGRQVQNAKLIAGKMMMMAHKLNINKGLGLGMSQLGAFARMGMMINISSSGNPTTTAVAEKEGDTTVAALTPDQLSPLPRTSTAFDPEIHFDLIDRQRGTLVMQTSFDNCAFRYCDDDDDAFYI